MISWFGMTVRKVWVPQVRGPHGQVFVRGVEIPFLGPGELRIHAVAVLAAEDCE
jgi:hypothetical protein